MSTRDIFLDDAKVRFKRELQENGYAICDCCERSAQITQRPMRADIVGVMVEMYRNHGQQWVDHPDKGLASRDFAILRHWGLTEQKERADGTRVDATWRVTDRGVEFIKGRHKAKKYILTYDRRCIGQTGPLVSIRKVLGDYPDIYAVTPAKLPAKRQLKRRGRV